MKIQSMRAYQHNVVRACDVCLLPLAAGRRQRRHMVRLREHQRPVDAQGRLLTWDDDGVGLVRCRG